MHRRGARTATSIFIAIRSRFVAAAVPAERKSSLLVVLPPVRIEARRRDARRSLVESARDAKPIREESDNDVAEASTASAPAARR